MKTLARHDDRSELQARVRLLRPDARARWGRMSVHQVVCHLADAFRMATGEIATADRSNGATRTVLKWVVLYAPLRWPPGVATSPEIHADVGGTRPTGFDADLSMLERLADDVSRPAAALDGRRHPLFGRMSRAEWLRWGYLHLDHHLRQFGV